MTSTVKGTFSGTAGEAVILDTNANIVVNSVAYEKMTLATAVATTSGTSIDFTGIPSWAKRITVMMYGVSTNGTSLVQAQIGSGSVVTTGYVSSGSSFSGAAVGSGAYTSGFVFQGISAAADVRNGYLVLTNISSNLWIGSYTLGNGANGGTDAAGIGGGNITLSGTLDRVRLTTVNGTDTFDAGSVNILYEGY